ncbi:MAG: carboxylating nicotinate-nucleotide diphosphorylase [Dehalococcoidia bacterium]
MDQRYVQEVIDRALREDLSLGDPTTDALIPPHLSGSARLVARRDGVLAGVDVALAAFTRVEPAIEGRALLLDGDRLKPGEAIATLSGPLAGMLKAERTALNFLQRMSGIASLTAQFVEAVDGTDARIVDTRKTAPGLRALDKYAVTCGGGGNHRFNLGDLVLIKDNHVAALEAEGVSLSQAVRRARTRARHNLRIEVEVENLEGAREALRGGADIILLDNMPVAEMQKAVEAVGGRAVTEASGNVSLDNVAAIAGTGVDLISVGELTHSVRALDIGLDYAGE